MFHKKNSQKHIKNIFLKTKLNTHGKKGRRKKESTTDKIFVPRVRIPLFPLII